MEKIMDLLAVAKALGIDGVPAEFIAFCEAGGVPVPLCDAALIDEMEKKYSMLGKYYPIVKEVAATVAKDADASLFGGLLAAYIAHAPISDVVNVPIPTLRDATVSAYFRLLIINAAMRAGIDAYRARGFSEAELLEMLPDVLGSRTAVSEMITKAPGLDGSGFGWLLNYAKALVFRAGIFNITPRPLYESSILLRNKVSGEYAVLVLSDTFHRSGMQLGSGGCMDTDGSFGADFCETEDAFIGRRIENARVLPELVTYPKSEWQEIVREGGGVVGIHIPRNVALTKENIMESYHLAFEMCRAHYPEVNVKAVHCSSWILDPQLEELLGAKSKIAGFQRTFLRYPRGGDGAAVYSFVFNCPKPESLAELPEETSLQRKLKSMYIDGGCIYIVGGYVPIDELCVY